MWKLNKHPQYLIKLCKSEINFSNVKISCNFKWVFTKSVDYHGETEKKKSSRLLDWSGQSPPSRAKVMFYW